MQCKSLWIKASAKCINVNVEVSLIFLCELNKHTLNMSLAKVVLFTLLRYSSICSQHIQMFSQLFKLSHLNKQFYIEQNCTSSLENILCYLLLKYYHCFKFYWLNLCCCCCCHCQLAVMWIKVHIFTDLKFDDPHHWEPCAEVLYMCISLQLV